MRLVTTGRTANGHPIINYEATYPNQAALWMSKARAACRCST